MNSFMHRSAMEPGGIAFELRRAKGLPPVDVPKHVFGWSRERDGWKQITWKEVHAKRSERDRFNLELKRRGEPGFLPAQVWTFKVPGNFFSGWWCYLRTIRGVVSGGGHKNNVPAASALAEHLMREIPLGLLPVKENFTAWMESLAKEHPRVATRSDRRKSGIVNGWTDGRWFWRNKP